MGGPVALRSPRAVLGAASPVFLNSTELVRERGPSGSNKSSTRQLELPDLRLSADQ